MLEIPLANIVRCEFLRDSGSQSSVLMIAVDDQTSSSDPRMQFFQCARTPVSYSHVLVLYVLHHKATVNVCIWKFMLCTGRGDL